jgi:hypothetical protein
MREFGDRDVGGVVEPCSPEATAPGDRWIEIELVGDDGEPIVGERYRVVTHEGRILEGRLGDAGRVRIEGIDAATCNVGFPDLDGDAWEPTSA